MLPPETRSRFPRGAVLPATAGAGRLMRRLMVMCGVRAVGWWCSSGCRCGAGRGSGVGGGAWFGGQSGRRSNGITAPNGLAQRDVIGAALREGDVGQAR